MEKKKPIILSIITIMVFVVLIVGATFAYFQAQVGEGKSTDVTVKSYTVDTFSFTTGNQISFSLNQENFASGASNLSGSTYASALLTANNETNSATEHYYLYLNIENNSFIYSINENTPEIIMTITDSEGNEVTNIDTLSHVIVTGADNSQVSGYDITNRTGLITLLNNREITATPTKEEKWNITITFVNYDASQNANAGKSMSAKIMLQKNVIPQVVGDVCNNGETLATCITTLSSKSQSSLTNIYHHDGTLANGINDGSYRYAGASNTVNNYICLGSTESPCPEANLFRIIGVFGDQVKVIRATSIGNMAWDSNSSNTWSTSSLNTYLNGEYLTSLGTLSDKIATTTWKVGGNTWANIAQSAMNVAYQNEITNSDASSSTDKAIEYNAKVGLMYLSDYGYAASPSAWTKILSSYDENDDNGTSIPTINWLIGLTEWTITRRSESESIAFTVNNTGHIFDDFTNSLNAVRPSFSLVSSVTYASGSGTQSDPIIIN